MTVLLTQGIFVISHIFIQRANVSVWAQHGQLETVTVSLGTAWTVGNSHCVFLVVFNTNIWQDRGLSLSIINDAFGNLSLDYQTEVHVSGRSSYRRWGWGWGRAHAPLSKN